MLMSLPPTNDELVSEFCREVATTPSHEERAGNFEAWFDAVAPAVVAELVKRAERIAELEAKLAVKDSPDA
jgi:hypothetical protein